MTPAIYTGEAAPGTYMLIYRAADTPTGQMVDSIRGIKIVAGEDLAQDDDMSRQEYIDKMTPEQKKQLEELKKTNAEAMKANSVINQLNADLKIVNQDKKDIDGAIATATQALGATATKTDIAAKAAEIKTAKYTDIESLMTKDTGLKPDEALLWVNLGFGQAGLKKYDDAIASYKKAVDLETAAKKPRPQVIGIADAGLGEVYARTGKVPEANAAYDASAKADPADAALNLRNEAIIFFQQGNSAAQVAAADEAIKVDPNQAILYYIKGQGLIQNATIDPTDASHRSASRLHGSVPEVPGAGSERPIRQRSGGHPAAGGRKGQFLLQGAQVPLESVIHLGADSVASENRIRRGGGRRLWPFQGEDDNEV